MKERVKVTSDEKQRTQRSDLEVNTTALRKIKAIKQRKKLRFYIEVNLNNLLEVTAYLSLHTQVLLRLLCLL